MRRFSRLYWRHVVVVVIGVPVVFGIAYTRYQNTHKQPVAVEAAQISRSGATTSTTISLEDRAYNAGDCVTWNQDPSVIAKSTNVVPCDQAHLFEYVSNFKLDHNADYPTKDEWDAIATQHCSEPIRAHLGYPLDPRGKFSAGVIKPAEESWLHGERAVDCGIQLTGTPDIQSTANHLASFVGPVKGQDQSLLLAVGNCYAESGMKAVTCDQLHDYQVIGNVNLAGKAAVRPADNAAWSHVVGTDCQILAGKRLPSGVQAGWLPIEQSSWDAGRRTLQCIAVKFDTSGHETPFTGAV